MAASSPSPAAVDIDGLLDNPRLDARAVRKVGTVTAGIRAAGPLKAPDLSVYAEPAMDQGDAWPT